MSNKLNCITNNHDVVMTKLLLFHIERCQSVDRSWLSPWLPQCTAIFSKSSANQYQPRSMFDLPKKLLMFSILNSCYSRTWGSDIVSAIETSGQICHCHWVMYVILVPIQRCYFIHHCNRFRIAQFGFRFFVACQPNLINIEIEFVNENRRVSIEWEE